MAPGSRKCEHLEPMHNGSTVPVASSPNGIVVHGMIVGGNRLKCSRMRIGQGAAGCAKDVAHLEVFKSFSRHQQECSRINPGSFALSKFGSFIVSPFISLAVAIKLGRGVGMSRPQAAPTFRRSRYACPNAIRSRLAANRGVSRRL